MSNGRLDHVAIEVPDLDAYIAKLTDTGVLRLLRQGSTRSGERIAMLGDGRGGKLELIEKTAGTEPRLAHVAFRCDDADAARSDLLAKGWQEKRGLHDLAAAKARTALLGDGSGFDLQVIAYQPDSPDIIEWAPDDDKP
jgi:catechol 2,3-dioxygenase-like lactoylglutathione lyase family enzyme